MTYETERRMLGISPGGEAGSQGPEARKKRRGLLRFSVASGRLTGMPVLGLLYPSFVLATDADPREWAATGPESPMLTIQEVLERARSVCARLLENITKYSKADGDVD